MKKEMKMFLSTALLLIAFGTVAFAQVGDTLIMQRGETKTSQVTPEQSQTIEWDAYGDADTSGAKTGDSEGFSGNVKTEDETVAAAARQPTYNQPRPAPRPHASAASQNPQTAAKEDDGPGWRPPQNRRQTAGVGPAGLGVMNGGGAAINGYYGALWEITPSIMLRAVGEATSDFSEAVLFSGIIGTQYAPLKNAAISPYIGGELGIGWGRAKKENAFGFEMGASLGLMLFQIADKHVLIEAQTTVLFDEIDELFPMKYSGRIGLVF